MDSSFLLLLPCCRCGCCSFVISAFLVVVRCRCSATTVLSGSEWKRTYMSGRGSLPTKWTTTYSRSGGLRKAQCTVNCRLVAANENSEKYCIYKRIISYSLKSLLFTNEEALLDAWAQVHQPIVKSCLRTSRRTGGSSRSAA